MNAQAVLDAVAAEHKQFHVHGWQEKFSQVDCHVYYQARFSWMPTLDPRRLQKWFDQAGGRLTLVGRDCESGGDGVLNFEVKP